MWELFAQWLGAVGASAVIASVIGGYLGSRTTHSSEVRATRKELRDRVLAICEVMMAAASDVNEAVAGYPPTRDAENYVRSAVLLKKQALSLGSEGLSMSVMFHKTTVRTAHTLHLVAFQAAELLPATPTIEDVTEGFEALRGTAIRGDFPSCVSRMHGLHYTLKTQLVLESARRTPNTILRLWIEYRIRQPMKKLKLQLDSRVEPDGRILAFMIVDSSVAPYVFRYLKWRSKVQQREHLEGTTSMTFSLPASTRSAHAISLYRRKRLGDAVKRIATRHGGRVYSQAEIVKRGQSNG